MIQMSEAAVMFVGSALVGLVVWLVRLEGRVNLGDQRHSDIKDDLREIKDLLKRIPSQCPIMREEP